MLAGSMVALVTPMDEQGSIDWAAFEGLIKDQLRAGTDALVINGTTAEMSTLSSEEREQSLRLAIELVNRSVPVIAGTGSNSTKSTLEASLAAKAIGADATLLVCPYYNKPTQEGLFRHFRVVAEAVALPHVLYNVPGRTAVDLDNATVVRLAGIPNIIGIKDATGDIARGRALVQSAPSDFIVLSGDDALTADLMLAGADGCISVTANLVPELMKQLCTLARAGKTVAVTELNERLMPLHKALFLESNPVPVKWVLQQMGKIASGIRLPLLPLSDESKPAVKQALVAVGVNW